MADRSHPALALPPAILEAVPPSERAALLETWRALTYEQRAGVLPLGSDRAARCLRQWSVREWRLREHRKLLQEMRRRDRADAYGEVRHAFYSLSLVRLPLALLLVAVVVTRQGRQTIAFSLSTRAGLTVNAIRFGWPVRHISNRAR